MSLRNFVRRTRLLIQQALHETRKLTQSGYERQLQLTRLEDRMLFSVSALASVVAQIAEVGGTLTLLNTAAGSLNTGTSGAVTSTYNAGTGIWSASGAIADVSTLLVLCQQCNEEWWLRKGVRNQ